MMETYEVVSVKDGKFHRPADPVFKGEASELREGRLMKCGRSLVPHNFFVTIKDADSYTGGRIEKYICQQCEHAAKEAQ